MLYISSGLKNSPYNAYLEEEQWDAIQEEFIKSACKLMGMPTECPLNVWWEIINYLLEKILRSDMFNFNP